jgi:hypothetical protein
MTLNATELADFTAIVLSAARRTVRSGQIALISDVYDMMVRFGYKGSLESVKANLLAADAADLLTLAKVDMPRTVDAAKLQESTINDRGMTFAAVRV